MGALQIATIIVASLPSLSAADRKKVKASAVKAGIDLTVVPGYKP